MNRLLILVSLAVCAYAAVRPEREKHIPEEPPELEALIPQNIGSWVFVEPKDDSPKADTSQAEFLNGMHIGAY